MHISMLLVITHGSPNVHVQQRSDHTGVIYRAFVVGPLDAIPISYIPYHMMISSSFFLLLLRLSYRLGHRIAATQTTTYIGRILEESYTKKKDITKS